MESSRRRLFIVLLLAGLVSIGLRHASFASNFCGDGTAVPPEQCDDGNDVSGDGCTSSCQDEFCGDGTTNDNGAEQCDDGNDMSGDGCNASCQDEYCGDGIVNDGAQSTGLAIVVGEQCDDGNDMSGDGCTSTCQDEYCGDGIVNDNGAEQCDDGNSDNLDSCTDECVATGDGDDVAAAVEDAGPGYGANGLGSGDGNGDGILDSTQSNVATLPAANGNGYLTVQSTGCDLTDVEASLPGDFGGDPGRGYPFGLVGFVLPDCESAQLKVFYHAASALGADSEYRKFGPTTPGVPATAKFYTLPGVVFGSENVNGSIVATAMFTLNDNQLGDDTGDDNTIVDQGGVAGGAHSVPATSNTGLVAMTALLALIGAMAIRRLTVH